MLARNLRKRPEKRNLSRCFSSGGWPVGSAGKQPALCQNPGLIKSRTDIIGDGFKALLLEPYRLLLKLSVVWS